MSLGLIALSAVSVATTAMEHDKGAETSVSNLKSRFESPQKSGSIVSQVEGDIKSASPLSTRNIASHLKEEAEVRAEKLVEAAQLVAQAEIEKIRQGVESTRVEADLEIKKIREGVELEKAKASQLRTELEALQQQKLALEQQKEKLQQDLEAAKSDALITKSGIIDKTKAAASYLNPWAYGKTTPPQNSSPEAKPTDPS